MQIFQRNKLCQTFKFFCLRFIFTKFLIDFFLCLFVLCFLFDSVFFAENRERKFEGWKSGRKGWLICLLNICYILMKNKDFIVFYKMSLFSPSKSYFF